MAAGLICAWRELHDENPLVVHDFLTNDLPTEAAVQVLLIRRVKEQVADAVPKRVPGQQVCKRRSKPSPSAIGKDKDLTDPVLLFWMAGKFALLDRTRRNPGPVRVDADQGVWKGLGRRPMLQSRFNPGDGFPRRLVAPLGMKAGGDAR